MLNLDAEQLASRLPYPRLIAALRVGLLTAIETPPREHHEVSDEHDLLLMMPSWRVGASVGVKLTSVFPSNVARGEPMIHAVYTLFDGVTGKPKAVLNGTELTARRTASIAALATDILGDPSRKRLLVMGTGALASHVTNAHLSLGGFDHVTIWGRSLTKAQAVVSQLAGEGVEASACSDAANAVGQADVICCVTSTREPILKSEWVKPGTHINLMGAYMPQMREADSSLMSRAHIYADHRAAVLAEAGDVLIPMAEGRLKPDCIIADMRELLESGLSARKSAKQPERITVFKSVGFGALDLIAAECALEASF